MHGTCSRPLPRPLARKTNYAFERINQAKAKMAKREAKKLAKLAARAEQAGAASAG